MLCNCNSPIQYRFQASDVTVFQAKHNIDSGKTRLQAAQAGADHCALYSISWTMFHIPSLYMMILRIL